MLTSLCVDNSKWSSGFPPKACGCSSCFPNSFVLPVLTVDMKKASLSGSHRLLRIIPGLRTGVRLSPPSPRATGSVRTGSQLTPACLCLFNCAPAVSTSPHVSYKPPPSNFVQTERVFCRLSSPPARRWDKNTQELEPVVRERTASRRFSFFFFTLANYTGFYRFLFSSHRCFRLSLRVSAERNARTQWRARTPGRLNKKAAEWS